MNITVSLVVTAITLLAGQIFKLLPFPNKYIPLQNILISIISIFVCIIFKVENMTILEIIVTCIISSMSAGGIADIKDIIKKEERT